MSFYCSKCATPNGRKNIDIPVNPSGTQYQLGKIAKHSIRPTGLSQTIGVFDNIENYYGFIVSASASGAFEIDQKGRQSLVYDVRQRVGTTYSSGYQRVDSAVRVVCFNNGQKVHAYPTASDQIRKEKCANCGKPLTY